MTIQVYGPVESQRDWTNSLREKLISDIRSGITERKPDTSDMIKIPAGKAIIGCEDSPDACLPFQTRNIGAFYIDRDEVTNAEYNRCVAEKQCLPPTNFPHMPGSSEPDHPALLTFKQAERYCLWAGKRLPTEYEWEKAARGKDGRLYPWGNDAPLKPVANVCGAECTMNWADPTWSDGYAYTAPVGRFPEDRSPYGLLDVAGNVKEWVASVAPLPQYHFIARGGSWYTKREQLRAWERQEWRQGIRLDDKGVRCAADGRGPIKKSATRPR
jgi:formylglycine-generating enzyme required for sulfatase activity